MALTSRWTPRDGGLVSVPGTALGRLLNAERPRQLVSWRGRVGTRTQAVAVRIACELRRKAHAFGTAWPGLSQTPELPGAFSCASVQACSL